MKNRKSLITIALACLVISACSSTKMESAPQPIDYNLPDYGQGHTGSASMGSMSSGSVNGKSDATGLTSFSSGMNGTMNADGSMNSDGSVRYGSGDVNALLEDMRSQSVYFDFDKFEVKPEYRDVLAHESQLIKSNSNVVVTLEGNADERGSSEYNLALGDKRANAVRKPLELLGVPASQIKTVSFGEAKPRKTCHDESCWSENRRVDFIGNLR